VAELVVGEAEGGGGAALPLDEASGRPSAVS
jgi:hypothetical protein